MKHTCWKNDKNEYVVGNYSYSWYTDSFKVSYLKEDKNIGKLAWFTVTTYDDINFGDWKNIGDWFETYKECIEYIDKHRGINLSISQENNNG